MTGNRTTTSTIHPATTIGAVHLTVRDLGRAVASYKERLGFKEGTEGTGGTVRLGAGGADLLVLHESPKAPVVHGATGLYHFAILVPSRAALAASLTYLLATRTPLQGASDHGVSEAIYLADPEGNGIEIYRDRPRDQWPRSDGHLAMGTAALDLDGLLAERMPDGGQASLPIDTVIGHMHLRVADIKQAEEFYLGVLGFDLMARYGSHASFVSAGGYHHHLGFNTWESLRAPAPPLGAVGLAHFELRLPTAAARTQVVERLVAKGAAMAETKNGPLVRDPSGNAIVLTTA